MGNRAAEPNRGFLPTSLSRSKLREGVTIVSANSQNGPSIGYWEGTVIPTDWRTGGRGLSAVALVRPGSASRVIQTDQHHRQPDTIPLQQRRSRCNVAEAKGNLQANQRATSIA